MDKVGEYEMCLVIAVQGFCNYIPYYRSCLLVKWENWCRFFGISLSFYA